MRIPARPRLPPPRGDGGGSWPSEVGGQPSALPALGLSRERSSPRWGGSAPLPRRARLAPALCGAPGALRVRPSGARGRAGGVVPPSPAKAPCRIGAGGWRCQRRLGGVLVSEREEGCGSRVCPSVTRSRGRRAATPGRVVWGGSRGSRGSGALRPSGGPAAWPEPSGAGRWLTVNCCRLCSPRARQRPRASLAGLSARYAPTRCRGPPPLVVTPGLRGGPRREGRCGNRARGSTGLPSSMATTAGARGRPRAFPLRTAASLTGALLGSLPLGALPPRFPVGEPSARGVDGTPSARKPSLAIREGAVGYRTPQPPPLLRVRE